MHGGSENGQKERDDHEPGHPPIARQQVTPRSLTRDLPRTPEKYRFVRSLPETWVIRHEMFNSSSTSITNSG